MKFDIKNNRFRMRKLFLDGFAKLRKVAVGFLSIRPSVRLFSSNNSAPTGRICMKFDIVRKSVKN